MANVFWQDDVWPPPGQGAPGLLGDVQQPDWASHFGLLGVGSQDGSGTFSGNTDQLYQQQYPFNLAPAPPSTKQGILGDALPAYGRTGGDPPNIMAAQPNMIGAIANAYSGQISDWSSPFGLGSTLNSPQRGTDGGTAGDQPSTAGTGTSSNQLNPADLQPVKTDPSNPAFALATPPGDALGGDTSAVGVAARPNVTIRFGSNVDPRTVSSHSLDVIRTQAAAQGITGLTISSAQRDARGQATAMYDNLVSQGESSQRTLYNANGNSVIDTAVTGMKSGASREATIDSMIERIKDIRTADPTAFKHLADPTRLQAIDIAPSSLNGRGTRQERIDGLVSRFRGDTSVSRVFSPTGGDPGIHIEIPQH
jgi:hypothetical protein